MNVVTKSDSLSPLYIACLNNHLEIVKILLQFHPVFLHLHQADPEQVSFRRLSILILLSKMRQLPKWLLHHIQWSHCIK